LILVVEPTVATVITEDGFSGSDIEIVLPTRYPEPAVVTDTAVTVFPATVTDKAAPVPTPRATLAASVFVTDEVLGDVLLAGAV
jgi:hypothetical protein